MRSGQAAERPTAWLAGYDRTWCYFPLRIRLGMGPIFRYPTPSGRCAQARHDADPGDSHARFESGRQETCQEMTYSRWYARDTLLTTFAAKRRQACATASSFPVETSKH